MIHILKLSNGDTIVGDLISEDEDCITLNNPLELQMVNNPMSGSGLMSMYWLPIDTEIFHVDIRQQHVIVLSKAPDEIQVFYKNSLSNFIKKHHLIHQSLEDYVGVNVPRQSRTREEDYEDSRQKAILYAHRGANTSIMH
jgi:hypothetical protein